MRALITDDVHPLLIDRLHEMGYEVSYQPEIEMDEVIAIIDRYEGLVINSKIYCGDELLSQAHQLKWVGRLGSGMEVIDKTECDARGVRYFNSPEGNRNAVAEHALGLLLDIMNHITRAHNGIQYGQWVREPNRGEELSGKTVGIIGYGNTGEAFGRVLGGFDVEILAYDPYRLDFETDRVKRSALEEIWAKADVVSLHLPLTEETRNMIDAEFLNKFQKPIYLINTSRGKVLRTMDLLAALENGRVIGAGLDVLENEKINALSEKERAWFDGLINDKRVVLTPHIAGWTTASKKKIAEIVADRVKSMLSH